MFSQNKKNEHGFMIRAYQGDSKTLLCFSLPEESTTNLAGFTIKCTPEGKSAYYLFNKLQFEHPEKHSQKKTEPPYSSINAPIQKFRWLHVPGMFHQEEGIAYGDYIYAVTPRYFNDEGELQPLDKNLTSTVTIGVSPFKKGLVELGFTRGFVQSAGFVNHFGSKAGFKPKKAKLLFNTAEKGGTNSDGADFSFKDEYRWSGFTAREKIFDILKEVQGDGSLTLDVFAYDLNEPDMMRVFMELAGEDRIRIILDDAALHHDKNNSKPEDQFEVAFKKAAANPGAIKRGKFGRFQHNKVLIIRKNGKAIKVLSGSTNFSVTGMYVNSNHVIVFNNKPVADLFADMFDEVWTNGVSKSNFIKSKFASQTFPFEKAGLPRMFIHFSPHNQKDAEKILSDITKRIKAEKNSVLFAVMDTGDKTTGPIAPALIKLHKRTDIFSGGITDTENELNLYKPSSPQGLRVTGKPGETILPAPFNKEPSIGLGHQIHHKFIVCGFNQPDAVVWLGSSNLALGGEMANGDNLIEIRDVDFATVFAIEGIALVDHFHFRDNHRKKTGDNQPGQLFLKESDQWSERYFEEGNIYQKDRKVFIGDTTTEVVADA